MVAKLEKEDHARDAGFSKAMHGQVSGSGYFSGFVGKGKEASAEAAKEYFKHWDGFEDGNETEEEKQKRLAEYATLTRQYYNLATDLYENGWSQSFHFCRFYPGEGFHQAIARHEHFLALKMGIKTGMHVLDVGCGVGGPAREIARFSDCRITGLNNNDYQIARASMYAQKAGLEKNLRFVKGDFMQMSFEEGTFDAVYAIEATVHAPRLEGVYGQIFKVLKPGGVFGVYEWLMTENFDETNAEHRKIRRGIELGDGIAQMVRIEEAVKALKAVGFEIEYQEDLAERPDAIPWYYPLAGDMKYCASLSDIFTIGRMTWLGRSLVHYLIGALELVGIAPQGTRKSADSLATAADALVAGGKQKLFTPMYLTIARKPVAL
ncbi:sterol 24-C-methyltransferase [Drechslerella stenobrocha 248]|uniref:Sterol 24-C-methyltransferase n=1 Tax=Drechslerella stenobrocha 248 TaxID=1043628 RepID=W7HJR7_9PEZI|nr:sterol 24-C-methyltransferase [Drechslerella stenobrocha 248]